MRIITPGNRAKSKTMTDKKELEVTVKTLGQLKEFLSTLSEGQLSQPIKVCELDRPYKYIGIFDILKEDHINPSGECAEPLSYYLPGGEGYNENEDYDYSIEPICAYKGDVFFHIYE